MKKNQIAKEIRALTKEYVSKVKKILKENDVLYAIKYKNVKSAPFNDKIPVLKNTMIEELMYDINNNFDIVKRLYTKDEIVHILSEYRKQKEQLSLKNTPQFLKNIIQLMNSDSRIIDN